MSDTPITLPLIIRALGRGKNGTRNLSVEEAKFTMDRILDGSITGPQLGAFLMLMRVKEETPSEIAGMVRATETALSDYRQFDVDVNWPAYAGKKKQPSWYIAAAKLLAQNGLRVFIHGAGEHTEGRQYARQACEALQIDITHSLSQAQQSIETTNITYTPLSGFLPVLSDLIDMKAELGLRSPINTIVRHVSPFQAKLTLQAMFHPAYMPLHHEAAIELKQLNNMVLKGDGGEFEVRPDSQTAIAWINGDQQLTTKLEPVLNRRRVRPDAVEMQPLIDTWQGEAENDYGVAAIIETAALVHSHRFQCELTSSQETVKGWWANRSPLSL